MVDAFVAAGFYAELDAARRAFRERTLFNVIEMASAAKIDLIVRRDRAFSIEEFQRRRPADLAFRAGVASVSPEDAILSKLEWAPLSGSSERQLDDVRGILEVTPHLNREYLDRWVDDLGLRALWQRVFGGP